MGTLQKLQNSKTLIILWPAYQIHTNSLFWVIFEELPFSSSKHFYSWQRLSNVVDLSFEYLSFSNKRKTTILFPSTLTFLQWPSYCRATMNKCVDELRNWMVTDKLMINDEKTEFLLIGSRQQLAKINTACSITVGEYDIDPSLCVRNLGVWFDSHLSMSTHVTKLCNSAFYHLHNIRCIRKYLSPDSLLALIHTLVTSRLDVCNSLLYGLPKSQIVKLQRVQNAAARLATIRDQSLTHVFPRLAPASFICVTFWLVHWTLCILCRVIFGRSFTLLNTAQQTLRLKFAHIRSVGCQGTLKRFNCLVCHRYMILALISYFIS